MRDSRLDAQTEQINELERDLADALRQVEDVRKHEADHTKARLEADKAKADQETAAVIAEMKREEGRFQQEFKAAQSIIEELNEKYASTKDSAIKSREELKNLRSEAKKLKIERNSYKNKAESLSKDLSKIANKIAIASKPQPGNDTEILTLTQTINQLQLHNSQLQNEVTTLRSQKRAAVEELQATRLAHEQSARYISVQLPITPSKDTQRATRQCDELESVISNLTEHLDASQLQINTLKQINESLLKEIDEVKSHQKG
jgi:chromosome segregation ATPase